MKARNEPSFSICIPNYNYAKYIRATIQSVLDQDYPHFEIIVADNASTDDSVAAVESFGSKKIKLVRNRYNIGFSPNLDRATRAASNDFLILLSSDDLMRPGALSTYAEVLAGLGDQAERSVLTSALDVIDGAGNTTAVMTRRNGALFYEELAPDEAARVDWSRLDVVTNRGHFALAESLRHKNTPAAFLTTCYSRTLYEAVEGYNNPYRVFPDAAFLNKLLAQDPTLVYVPKRLFAYRVHQGNQLGLEARQQVLKYQIDAYMHTAEFPQDVLDEIGVARRELVDVFIEKAVMERGLQALAGGNRIKALKCLAFGFATYPGQSLREPKTYGLAGLLGLGPAAAPVARALQRGYQRLRRGVSP